MLALSNFQRAIDLAEVIIGSNVPHFPRPSFPRDRLHRPHPAVSVVPLDEVYGPEDWGSIVNLPSLGIADEGAPAHPNRARMTSYILCMRCVARWAASTLSKARAAAARRSPSCAMKYRALSAASSGVA
jgi:hypothetical protein